MRRTVCPGRPVCLTQVKPHSLVRLIRIFGKRSEFPVFVYNSQFEFSRGNVEHILTRFKEKILER